MYFGIGWRRYSVPLFVRRMVERHPELAKPCDWAELLTIAHREGVWVRVVPLSRPARLVRFGRHVAIQISDSLPKGERAHYGFHELAHFWRDDIGEPCFYADNETYSREEEFCEIFGWFVTSTAREYFDKPGWDF